MGYKKFRADALFDGYQLRQSNDVLILTETGMVENIVPVHEAGEEVQVFHGLLSPGFINCHCHLELSHMKNMIPQKTGLIDFVFKIMTTRHVPEKTILQEIEKAEEEMWQGGIVAVGDICNNILTIPQKLKGKLYYHNFIEVAGFLPQIAEQRFQKAVEIYKEYSGKNHLPASMVPHAPYSLSDKLWQKIVHFPGNQLMTIHNQETEEENKFFREKKGDFLKLYENINADISFFSPTGKTSLQSCLGKFLPSQPLIAVHNVHTSEADILFAKNTGMTIYWCFCPNANLYITGDLPGIDSFIKQDCSIVLGTDSLASNQQLSILAEMQTIQQHFPSVKIENMLQWATINGAKALQMESLLGSFERGKKPGVALIEPALSSVRRLM